VSAALLLAACTATGAGAGGSTTRPPVTRPKAAPAAMESGAQMAAIVAATMATNNQANEQLDHSLLESYEAGSALVIDSASYQESAHVANSGCSYPPFGVKVLQTIAKTGTTYPAQFIVLGNTYQMKPLHGCTASAGTCPSAGTILVFSRPSASSPWKIVLEPSADNGDAVRLRGAGPSGTGSVAAPLPPAGTDAKAVPSEIAKALESYEASGRLGSLKASYFTGSCWLIPDPRAAAQQYSKSSLNETETYSPLSDLVSYTTASGVSVLSIFTLSFEVRLAPEGADASIEWVSDPASEPVTGLLPSGAYSQIVEQGSLEIAAVVSGAGSADVTIVGAYGGVTSISGTKGSTGSGGGVLVSYVS